MKSVDKALEYDFSPEHADILGSAYPLPLLACYKISENRLVLLRNTLSGQYKHPKPKSFSLSAKEHDLLRRLKVASAFLEESLYCVQEMLDQSYISPAYSVELPLPVADHFQGLQKWIDAKFFPPCTVVAMRTFCRETQSCYYSLACTQVYPPEKIEHFDKRTLYTIAAAASHYNSIVIDMHSRGLIVCPAHFINEDIQMAVAIGKKLPDNIEILDI